APARAPAVPRAGPRMRPPGRGTPPGRGISGRVKRVALGVELASAAVAGPGHGRVGRDGSVVVGAAAFVFHLSRLPADLRRPRLVQHRGGGALCRRRAAARRPGLAGPGPVTHAVDGSVAGGRLSRLAGSGPLLVAGARSRAVAAVRAHGSGHGGSGIDLRARAPFLVAGPGTPAGRNLGGRAVTR